MTLCIPIHPNLTLSGVCTYAVYAQRLACCHVEGPGNARVGRAPLSSLSSSTAVVAQAEDTVSDLRRQNEELRELLAQTAGETIADIPNLVCLPSIIL